MNCNKIKQKMRTSVLTVAALTLMSFPAFAVDLVAIEGQWSPDGDTQIRMWGFTGDTEQACDSLPAWTVGPELTNADLIGGNLTVNLRNCLSDAVSIVIPGQSTLLTPQTITDGQGRIRVTAFTHEADPNGGTAVYTWNSVKPGTYLYQSGSHPAKQMQMGLYGALKLGDYSGTSGDVTLLYSEIDPNLHNPPAAATPLGYKPRYYLVNGSASGPVLLAGDTDKPTVLSFLNAGLDFHVPALNGGHMTLVAEDGNSYPFTKEQYSVNLPAGKTIDAFWQPETSGEHVIYDRRGNGMVAILSVTEGSGAPVAMADTYTVDKDSSLVTIAGDLTFPGVLDNDSGAGLTALLVSAPSSGSLTSGLALNGSFSYLPNVNFSGIDSFTYRANNGSVNSNIASVNITVTATNFAPVAGDDTYDVATNTVLNIAAPGVLSNDTDTDSDVLNSVLSTGPTSGSLMLNSDGSFDYTPDGAAVHGDSASFTYFANDGTVNSAVAGTVTINIIAPNIAPVAVADLAEVSRNSRAVFINLTDNDSDVDGNLKDGSGNVASSQITITTGTKSTRGGTVTVVMNGVDYKPKRRFRGTDTFNYTVTDFTGAISNEVVVRVNVIKKKKRRK